MAGARTPEGYVKAAVKAVLAAYKPLVYGHWFIPTQQRGVVDYHGCACGLYFVIECKSDGHQAPTPLQLLTMQDVGAALGQAFLVRSVDGDDIRALDAWLHHVVMQHKAKLHRVSR